MAEKTIAIADQDNGLGVAVRDALQKSSGGDDRVIQLMHLVAGPAGLKKTVVTGSAMSAVTLDGLLVSEPWFEGDFSGAFDRAEFFGVTAADTYGLSVTATESTITATLTDGSTTVATASGSNAGGGTLVFQVDGVDFMRLEHPAALPVGTDTGDVEPTPLQTSVVTVGDGSALAVYGAFSGAVTGVAVTPLLLNDENAVIGMLTTKSASVSAFIAGGNYLMQALQWSELAGHNKFAFHVTYTGEDTAWLTVAVL